MGAGLWEELLKGAWVWEELSIDVRRGVGGVEY